MMHCSNSIRLTILIAVAVYQFALELNKPLLLWLQLASLQYKVLSAESVKGNCS